MPNSGRFNPAILHMIILQALHKIDLFMRFLLFHLQIQLGLAEDSQSPSESEIRKDFQPKSSRKYVPQHHTDRLEYHYVIIGMEGRKNVDNPRPVSP